MSKLIDSVKNLMSKSEPKAVEVDIKSIEVVDTIEVKPTSAQEKIKKETQKKCKCLIIRDGFCTKCGKKAKK